MFVKLYNKDCIRGMNDEVEDGSVDLIIADPPFGIDETKFHNMYNRDFENVIPGYEEVKPEHYHTFTASWVSSALETLREGGSFYIVSGYTNLRHILNVTASLNLQLINHIIWKYNFGTYTTRKYVSSHYHILYYEKPGGDRTFNLECRYEKNARYAHGKSKNYADREDVWAINREYRKGEIKNSNKLPTELVKKMIQYSSNKDDIVLDPFMGNFTTAEVGIPLERNVIGFEINTEAFDYFSKKLQDQNNLLDIEFEV